MSAPLKLEVVERVSIDDAFCLSSAWFKTAWRGTNLTMCVRSDLLKSSLKHPVADRFMAIEDSISPRGVLPSIDLGNR